MKDDDTHETCMLLRVERDKYGMAGIDIIASPIFVTSDDHVRNISADSWRPNPLADLQIRARADREATFGDTYGWGYAYRDVFSVDAERAAVMHKQLRAIERGLAKLEVEFGTARDFGSYLARVARVLKIKRFGWKVSGNDHWHDSNEYHWGDVLGMQYWVERQIREYREPAGAHS